MQARVVAQGHNLAFELPELVPGLGRKSALCQEPLTLGQLWLQRAELALGVLGLGDQALGLRQPAMARLAVLERFAELGELRFGELHVVVQHAIVRLVASKLVAQARALDRELSVQGLLVARIHRASTRRTRRQLVELVQLRTQVEHLLFELCIDGPLLGRFLAALADQRLQLLVLRLDRRQGEGFLLDPPQLDLERRQP